MNRTELDRLDRDTLIARAEASGVVRARILTRPELIDELIQRARPSPAESARARGFFGRARDLLARVIERGLHLPDAAERLRRSTLPPPIQAGAPVPTVTLAQIYAAQGHRERAIETLRDVLGREPEHVAARDLLLRLEDTAYVGPKPPTLPPEEEATVSSPPRAPHPPAPSPTRGEGEQRDPVRTDRCVATPMDTETLRVSWQVSDWTRSHLEGARPGGAFVLRVRVISPTWDGPLSTVQDIELDAEQRDVMLRPLPRTAVVCAAIGWRVSESLVPIAHSLASTSSFASASST